MNIFLCLSVLWDRIENGNAGEKYDVDEDGRQPLNE
jgi:hypothetical protein